MSKDPLPTGGGSLSFQGGVITWEVIVAKRNELKVEPNRAAIYARVSDKSQATEDRTSISEQVADMEAHCQRRGLTIVVRYQEVGRGWSKKRPEFQRMLEDARQGRFDTIVCWKSDRLSRGVYPAAALMEVVEAYRINIEAVMDAIDMKYFGLMAAIGKIEIDNFRERSSMGKRGAAKRGRIPSGGLPYGYRIGDDGKPEVVGEEAEVVRRIFRQYVHEDMGTRSITRRLAEEGVPHSSSAKRWHQSHVYRMLGNETYKGVWTYGQTRVISTDDGKKVYGQPRETWIQVVVPPLVDEETWDRAQSLKKERLKGSRRNTKVFYLLQHMVRCAECGTLFGARASWFAMGTRNGRRYRYDRSTPLRYYRCYGMEPGQRCRERPYIRAELLEGLVWREVRHMIRNPDLILAGIESIESGRGDGVAEETVKVERELRRVQQQEDRAIGLFVEGKITGSQLEHQRGLIAERIDGLRSRLDDCRGRQAAASDRRLAMENILKWSAEIGDGIDDIAPEKRKEMLRMIVEGVMIDRHNKVEITLALPVEKSLSIDSQPSTWRDTSTARLSWSTADSSPVARPREKEDEARKSPCHATKAARRDTLPPRPHPVIRTEKRRQARTLGL